MPSHPIMLPGVNQQVAVYPGYAPGSKLGRFSPNGKLGDSPWSEVVPVPSTQSGRLRFDVPGIPMLFGIVGAVVGAFAFKNVVWGVVGGGVLGYVVSAGGRAIKEAGA